LIFHFISTPVIEPERMNMETVVNGAQNRMQAIADSLGCVTGDDLCELAKVKESTLEAWRKRGIGPSYVRFGNTFLYPRVGLAKHIESLTRERNAPTKALL
jgi:hypothetical protein